MPLERVVPAGCSVQTAVCSHHRPPCEPANSSLAARSDLAFVSPWQCYLEAGKALLAIFSYRFFSLLSDELQLLTCSGKGYRRWEVFKAFFCPVLQKTEKTVHLTSTSSFCFLTSGVCKQFTVFFFTFQKPLIFAVLQLENKPINRCIPAF